MAVLSGIYRITVDRGDKPPRYYIGQSVNLEERKKQHLRALRTQRHDNIPLLRAYNKYGEASIGYEIILICALDCLEFYEQVILDFYVLAHGTRVLNVMRESIKSHRGVKRRPESIAKLAAALRGKKRTPEQNEANRQRRLGTKHTAEAKAKMAAAQKGRPGNPMWETISKSPNRVINLRKALAGKPKIHSKETCAKIAASLTGKKQSAASNEKRRATQTGRKQTPEHTSNRTASRLRSEAAKRLSWVLEAL